MLETAFPLHILQRTNDLSTTLETASSVVPLTVFSKSDIKDIMTGLPCHELPLCKNIPVLSRNFEIETEMTIHAIDKNMQVENVIIEYRDRPEGSESKLNTYADGFKVLKTIMKMFKITSRWSSSPLSQQCCLWWEWHSLFRCWYIFWRLGQWNKLPTLIVKRVCDPDSDIICWFSGIILSTLVNQHKQDFEYQTQMVTNRYKDLFPEEEIRNQTGQDNTEKPC